VIKLFSNNPIVRCRFHPHLACTRDARFPGNICTAESERFAIEKTHALAILSEICKMAIELPPDAKEDSGRNAGAEGVRHILQNKREQQSFPLQNIMGGGGGDK
jgi:hypothetical protein